MGEQRWKDGQDEEGKEQTKMCSQGRGAGIAGHSGGGSIYQRPAMLVRADSSIAPIRSLLGVIAAEPPVWPDGEPVLESDGGALPVGHTTNTRLPSPIEVQEATPVVPLLRVGATAAPEQSLLAYVDHDAPLEETLVESQRCSCHSKAYIKRESTGECYTLQR